MSDAKISPARCTRRASWRSLARRKAAEAPKASMTPRRPVARRVNLAGVNLRTDAIARSSGVLDGSAASAANVARRANTSGACAESCSPVSASTSSRSSAESESSLASSLRWRLAFLRASFSRRRRVRIASALVSIARAASRPARASGVDPSIAPTGSIVRSATCMSTSPPCASRPPTSISTIARALARCATDHGTTASPNHARSWSSFRVKPVRCSCCVAASWGSSRNASTNRLASNPAGRARPTSWR